MAQENDGKQRNPHDPAENLRVGMAQIALIDSESAGQLQKRPDETVELSSRRRLIREEMRRREEEMQWRKKELTLQKVEMEQQHLHMEELLREIKKMKHRRAQITETREEIRHAREEGTNTREELVQARKDLILKFRSNKESGQDMERSEVTPNTDGETQSKIDEQAEELWVQLREIDEEIESHDKSANEEEEQIKRAEEYCNRKEEEMNQREEDPKMKSLKQRMEDMKQLEEEIRQLKEEMKLLDDLDHSNPITTNLFRYVPAPVNLKNQDNRLNAAASAEWDARWELSIFPSLCIESHNANCIICLIDFEEPRRAGYDEEKYSHATAPGDGAPEPLRQLPCRHVFHRSCIDNQLRESSRRCPVCRRRVGKKFIRMWYPPSSSDESKEDTPEGLGDNLQDESEAVVGESDENEADEDDMSEESYGGVSDGSWGDDVSMESESEGETSNRSRRSLPTMFESSEDSLVHNPSLCQTI
ncbi:hypothetical protein FRC02_009569 [Tulasnella sp. 418]|nr:hypothetical protein FRC02_009569 [Tulasnella sp. 418]